MLDVNCILLVFMTNIKYLDSIDGKDIKYCLGPFMVKIIVSHFD